MFRKAFFNTGAQLVGRLLSSIFVFIATLLLAGQLGSHSFGEYIKVTAYITLFYPLVDFGLNTVYLAEAKHKETSLFSAFLTLRVIFSLVAVSLLVVVTYVVASVTKSLHVTPLSLAIGASSLIAYGLTLTVHVLFQAKLEYQKTALAFGIGSSVFLIVTLFFYLFLDLGEGASLFAIIIYALSGWATAVASMILYKGNLLDFAYVPKFWKKITLAGLPLGTTLLLNFVYIRLDTFILSATRPSAEVGAYGFAYKFFDFSLILPFFFMNSLYPELIKRKEGLGLRADFSIIRRILLLASLLAVVAIWFLAPFLTVVNADYEQSVYLLRLLALGLPVFYLSSPYMWWYVIHKRQKLLIYIYGSALLVTLGLNVVLIPRYGANGAAVTTGIAELMVLLLSLKFAQYDKTA